jgi:hypothetical protein
MYPLPDRPPIIRAAELAAKRPVVELYDHFEQLPYDESGAFVLSLEPYTGQLGEYVFLKDDPDHVYAVPFGSQIIGKKDAVSLAREEFAR